MRIKYYDSIKFFAIFIVFTNHFIYYYNTGLVKYWNEHPYDLFLKGINGKFSVALLGIIMCRFAYCAGLEKRYSISKYIIRRYLFFVIYGLFINSVYLIIYSVQAKVLAFPISYLLKTTLMLGSDIFPTFWCIQPYFMASVIAYILGFVGGREKVGIIMILVFLICNNIWVAVCLFGTLIPYIEKNHDIWRRKWTKYLLFILFFVIGYRDESNIAYIMWGISSIILIMLVESSGLLKGILEGFLFQKLGKYTMSVFIIHVLVYQLIGAWLLGTMNKLPNGLSMLLCYFICLILIVLISIPLTNILDLIYKKTVCLLIDILPQKIGYNNRKNQTLQ